MINAFGTKKSDLVVNAFFPYKDCVIKSLYEIYKKFFSTNDKAIYSKRYVNNFGTLLGELGIPYPNKLIIFAHPSEDHMGLKITGSFGGQVIYPGWWKKQPVNEPYKKLFAFVCEGNRVFKQSQWQSIFPYWISFNKKIYFYLGSRLSRKSYKKIWSCVFKELKNNQTIEININKIKESFDKVIMQLIEKHDIEKGEQLTLMYVISAYRSLCKNDPYDE